MFTVAASPLLEQFVTDAAYIEANELGLTDVEARRIRIAYRRTYNVYEANHPGCLAEQAEIAGLRAAHAEHARVLAERPSTYRIHDQADELWWAMARDAEERGTLRVIRAADVAKRWTSLDNANAPNDHAGSFIGH